MPTQFQWLAFSVSAHKTQTTGQLDGYTVLLQPQPQVNEQSHEDDGINPAGHPAPNADADAESEHVPGTGVDVEMTEPQAVEQKQPQSTPYRKGFQRYLCAEYIDSLT